MPDTLPCATCDGRCCTAAPFRPSELRAARIANGGRYPVGARVLTGIRVKAEHGGGMSALVVTEDGTCAFLVGGQCSIYEARPQVCRLYGEIPDLPCIVVDPEGAARAAERKWQLVTDLLKVVRQAARKEQG